MVSGAIYSPFLYYLVFPSLLGDNKDLYIGVPSVFLSSCMCICRNPGRDWDYNVISRNTHRSLQAGDVWLSRSLSMTNSPVVLQSSVTKEF